MGETVAATGRVQAPWARVLVVVGALTTVAAAVVGVLWLQRMPELQPVEFGQQTSITATDTTSATVFTTTGLSRPPTCQATSGSGSRVILGTAGHYRQERGLESAFGFRMTSGTTYTVTCSSGGGPGRFAVAQDPAAPVGVFIAVGSLGLLLCCAGVVLAVRRSRASVVAPDSTS